MQRNTFKPHEPKPCPRPSTAMAPIAASSQSKAKLRAFQYEESNDAPRSPDTEKENQDPKVDAPTIQMDPPPQPLSQRSATKDTRDCPQTPVGRLPLTDLIACGDDTSHRHLNLTPIERVLWDQSPVISETSTSKRRSRKRAHSSSPASSSQNETSHHFESTKPQVDLQALQKALKTPKADPADDLWSRYSLSTRTAERRSPTAPTSLVFTQLVHSSSPPTPASHLQSKDGSGLRRALSCIEWPTSAAKRRKLQRGGFYKDSSSGLARIDKEADTNETSRISRVSFLVEKIHDGLTKPPVTDEISSSEPARSSPVARKVNDSPIRQDIPSQEGEIAIDEVVDVLSQTAVAPKEHMFMPLVLSAEEIADLEKADSSSDFGDDDLDLEMVESVDATLKAFPSADANAGSLPCRRSQIEATQAVTTVDPREHIQKPHQPGAAQAQSGNNERLSQISFLSEVSSSPAQAAAAQQDEFDEDEDEVSAADLEDMFAQYDTQPQQPAPGAQDRHAKQAEAMPSESATDMPRESIFGPKPVIRTHIEVLSDDEDFGDDSDFEQIAAECAEATQQQQVAQPQSSVRTEKFSSFIS